MYFTICFVFGSTQSVTIEFLFIRWSIVFSNCAPVDFGSLGLSASFFLLSSLPSTSNSFAG